METAQTNQVSPNPPSFSITPLRRLKEELEARFVERSREIDAVLVGLLASKPVLLIGPPGTAKTMMIEVLAKLVGGRYFYYLLSKFTEPDELLGPVDIEALKRGEFRRILDNRLASADLVLLDEVFKSSSAVLNMLLDIILNRRLLNGTTYVAVPALTIYGASNEIPTDEELAAFYDRWTVRAFVHYVSMSAWRDLLTRSLTAPPPGQIVTIDYIRQAQRVVQIRAQHIIKEPAYVEKIVEARAELQLAKVEMSDRRMVELVQVFAAISILYGETPPSLDSLADALLFVAPHEEDDVTKIEDVIAKLRLRSVDTAKLSTIITEARNAVKRFQESQKLSDLQLLKELRRRLADLRKEYELSPRARYLLQKIDAAISSIDQVLNI